MGPPSPLVAALNEGGTVVLAAGSLAVALLLLFLARSVKRRHFTLWAWAWVALAVAGFALLASIRLGPAAKPFEVVSFLSQYAFGFLLIAGFRRREGRGWPSLGRREGLLAAVALATAIALAHLHPDFYVRFVPQAALLVCFFAVALRSVLRQRSREGPTPGLRIVTVALLGLMFDFLHYLPVVTWATLRKLPLAAAWSAYAPIIDLLLETALAFGLINLATGDLRRDLEQANLALRDARDRLVIVARTDALTEALNRHAFAAFAEEARGEGTGERGGSVVVLDLDGLKHINDRHGHNVGDMAIRKLARAVRTVVRADDLVYRWGGDEFLVVLPGVAPEEAVLRFARFDDVLAEHDVEGLREIDLTACWGAAAYSPERPMGEAVEAADAALYEKKRERRGY